jgi:hypothetical protein
MMEVGGPLKRLGKICKPFTTTLGCSGPNWEDFAKSLLAAEQKKKKDASPF